MARQFKYGNGDFSRTATYRNGPIKDSDSGVPNKNIGSAVAKDVTIEWAINNIDLHQIIESSTRLKGFVTKLTDNKFAVFSGAISEDRTAEFMRGLGFRGVIASPPYSGYFMAYSARENSNIPYLAPEINNTGYQEADMPIGVCQFLELYVVATLPPEGPPGTSTISVPIDASVRWKSPEGGNLYAFEL